MHRGPVHPFSESNDAFYEVKIIEDQELKQPKQNPPPLVRQLSDKSREIGTVVYGEKEDKDRKPRQSTYYVMGDKKLTPEERKHREQVNQDFKAEFNLLLNFFKKWGEEHKFDVSEIKLFRDNIFNKDFSGDQAATFFTDIKRNLEEIACYLADRNTPHHRKLQFFKVLTENFAVCGPGFYHHSVDMVVNIKSRNSIPFWLADLRRNIITQEYAGKYIAERKVRVGFQPHIANLFNFHAIENGLAPLVGATTLEDKFLDDPRYFNELKIPTAHPDLIRPDLLRQILTVYPNIWSKDPREKFKPLENLDDHQARIFNDYVKLVDKHLAAMETLKAAEGDRMLAYFRQEYTPNKILERIQTEINSEIKKIMASMAPPLVEQKGWIKTGENRNEFITKIDSLLKQLNLKMTSSDIFDSPEDKPDMFRFNTDKLKANLITLLTPDPIYFQKFLDVFSKKIDEVQREILAKVEKSFQDEVRKIQETMGVKEGGFERWQGKFVKWLEMDAKQAADFKNQVTEKLKQRGLDLSRLVNPPTIFIDHANGNKLIIDFDKISGLLTDRYVASWDAELENPDSMESKNVKQSVFYKDVREALFQFGLEIDAVFEFKENRMKVNSEKLKALFLNQAADAHQKIFHERAWRELKNDAGQFYLHTAAIKGEIACVEMLLKYVVPDFTYAQLQDKAGKTPLHYAIEYKHANVADKILDLLSESMQVAPNVADQTHRTPLHYAVELEQFALARKILEQHKTYRHLDENDFIKDLDTPNPTGKTLLATAHEFKMLELIDDILSEPSVSNLQNTFIGAIRSGALDLVQSIIEKNKVNLKAPGNNYLELAIVNNQPAIAKLLMLSGVDVAESKENYFHLALKHNAYDIVDLFLERNDRILDSIDAKSIHAARYLSPNEPDQAGHVPLFYAIKNDNIKLARKLFQQLNQIYVLKGARDPFIKNLNQRDAAGKTLLDYVLEHQSIELARDILMHPGVKFAPAEYPSSFYQAFESGNANLAGLFIDSKKFAFNVPDKNGNTPLTLAIKNKQFGIVRLLLKELDPKQLSLNLADKSGDTLLQLAIKNNQPDIVKLLLKSGASLLQEGDRESYLHVAIKNKAYACLDILLELNALKIEEAKEVKTGAFISPNALDKEGQTALFYAIKENNQHAIKALLEQHRQFYKKFPSDTFIQNIGRPNSWWDGNTLVDYLAQYKLYDILSEILLHPTTPIQGYEGSRSLLWQAVAQENIELVDLLLKTNKISVDGAPGDDGLYPLHIAIQKKNLPLIKLLVRYGANQSCNSWRENNALHFAVESGQLDILNLLLEQKPSCINTPNNRGETPLIFAVKAKNFDMIKSLIRAGANPFLIPSRSKFFPEVETSVFSAAEASPFLNDFFKTFKLTPRYMAGLSADVLKNMLNNFINLNQFHRVDELLELKIAPEVAISVLPALAKKVPDKMAFEAFKKIAMLYTDELNSSALLDAIIKQAQGHNQGELLLFLINEKNAHGDSRFTLDLGQKSLIACLIAQTNPAQGKLILDTLPIDAGLKPLRAAIFNLISSESPILKEIAIKVLSPDPDFIILDGGAPFSFRRCNPQELGTLYLQLLRTSQFDVANQLRLEGVDIALNLADTSGNTAMHYMALDINPAHLPVLKAFEDKAISPAWENKQGQTCLSLAADANNLGFIEYFLKNPRLLAAFKPEQLNIVITSLLKNKHYLQIKKILEISNTKGELFELNSQLLQYCIAQPEFKLSDEQASRAISRLILDRNFDTALRILTNQNIKFALDFNSAENTQRTYDREYDGWNRWRYDSDYYMRNLYKYPTAPVLTVPRALLIEEKTPVQLLRKMIASYDANELHHCISAFAYFKRFDFVLEIALNPSIKLAKETLNSILQNLFDANRLDLVVPLLQKNPDLSMRCFEHSEVAEARSRFSKLLKMRDPPKEIIEYLVTSARYRAIDEFFHMAFEARQYKMLETILDLSNQHKIRFTLNSQYIYTLLELNLFKIASQLLNQDVVHFQGEGRQWLNKSIHFLALNKLPESKEYDSVVRSLIENLKPFKGGYPSKEDYPYMDYYFLRDIHHDVRNIPLEKRVDASFYLDKAQKSDNLSFLKAFIEADYFDRSNPDVFPALFDYLVKKKEYGLANIVFSKIYFSMQQIEEFPQIMNQILSEQKPDVALIRNIFKSYDKTRVYESILKPALVAEDKASQMTRLERAIPGQMPVVNAIINSPELLAQFASTQLAITLMYLMEYKQFDAGRALINARPDILEVTMKISNDKNNTILHKLDRHKKNALPQDLILKLCGESVLAFVANDDKQIPFGLCREQRNYAAMDRIINNPHFRPEYANGLKHEFLLLLATKPGPYTPAPPRQTVNAIFEKLLPYCNLNHPEDRDLVDKAMQFLANPMLLPDSKEEKLPANQYSFLPSLVALSVNAEEKNYKDFVKATLGNILQLTRSMDGIVDLLTNLEGIREQIPHFCKQRGFMDREAKPASPFWSEIYNQCKDRIFELAKQGVKLEQRNFDGLHYWKPKFTREVATNIATFEEYHRSHRAAPE